VRLRAKKALIVTDPILEKAGLLERARQPLVGGGFLQVGAFTGGEPEPSMRAALACYDMAKSFQARRARRPRAAAATWISPSSPPLCSSTEAARAIYVGDDKIRGQFSR